MKTFNELKESIIETKCIVKDMIREKGLYCLLGEAKVGKSALALQIANSIINSKLFLDKDTNKTPILYISTEMTPIEIIERTKFMKFNLEENFLYTSSEEGTSQISIYKIRNEIDNFKKLYNGKLVFIDMFNGINFGLNYDLNNYQDMSQSVFPQLRKLCNDFDVTIIFIHHLNRRGKSLGSTAIDTCVDGKISLKKDENLLDTFYLSYESRDFPSLKYTLKRDNNLNLFISNEDDETLDPNLIQFLKYAIRQKEFTYKASDMVSKLNLFITPPVLGKLIASNKEKLERLGLYIEEKRTSTERLYYARFSEPIEMADNEINPIKKEVN